jgi:hypothetical protein
MMVPNLVIIADAARIGLTLIEQAKLVAVRNRKIQSPQAIF